MRDLIRRILSEHICEERVKYTPDILKDIAKKYKSKKDFYTNDPNAYAAAKRKGLLSDLTKNMVDLSKGIGIRGSKKYSKDELLKLASNYSSISDFNKEQPKAVYIARYFGWYDDLVNHMSRFREIWTKDKVWERALSYQHIKDFLNNDKNAYHAAHRNGWLDDVTAHMVPLGSRYERKIYVYEFPDNSAYIGLTYDEKRRTKSHSEDLKSAVFQHIQKTGLEPNFKLLTPELISSEEAKVKEKEFIKLYKDNGWNVLNRAVGGSLGGSHSKDWTKEKIKEIAFKYKTRTEFCKKASMACQMARKLGIFDDVTSHMEIIYEPWNFDKIYKEAQKYNDFLDFRKNSKAYQPAKLRGILDNVTSHMTNRRMPWTKERFIDVIKKYDSFSDFRKNEPSGYVVANKTGFIDFIKDYYKNK